MKYNITDLFLLSLILIFCNPFTWLQNGVQDNKIPAIIFLVAGLIVLLAAVKFITKTLKGRSLTALRKKEIIDKGIVLLLYILPAVFLLRMG